MFNELEVALKVGLDGCLNNNNYAKGLFHFLTTQSELPTIQQLVAIDSTSKSPDSIVHENNLRDNILSDFRFLRLDVKGIRKFPSDKWYTLQFNDNNNQPISSIFLGSNGAGKSSLYSALEYASLGHSYLSDERGYKDSEQRKEYMHNIDYGETGIILHTKHDVFSISIDDEYIKPKTTSAYFCSEYDIQEISREGLSPQYICTQLGLNRFLEIINMMQGLKNKYDDAIETFSDEINQIFKLQKRINIMCFLVSMTDEEIKKVEDFVNNESKKIKLIPVYSTVQQLCERLKKYIGLWNRQLNELNNVIFTEINSDIKYVKDKLRLYEATSNNPSLENTELLLYINSILNIWNEEIINLKKDYEKRRYHYIQKIFQLQHELYVLTDKTQKKKESTLLLNKTEEDVRQFNETLRYLHESYILLLKKHIDIINKILPPIFAKYYFDKDIRDIKVLLDENKNKNKDNIGNSIKVVIQLCNPYNKKPIGKTDNPRRFLNTFRFKLFCFLLKFAFVCSIKKLYSINFPFVVDDVFNASDFDNRIDVGYLIREMFDTHNKIDGLSDMPLQLIFFTQDNLIADVINREMLYDNKIVKYSRLFDYIFGYDTDYIDNEHNYIKIEDIIQ